MGSKRIKSNLHSARNKLEKIILDPREAFLQSWNKIFLLFCIIAMALDPLFFYIPVVVNDETRKCLNLDKRLGIIACVLRTFMDAFHIIHMIFQLRTGFIAASSRIFGTGELIVNPRTIAKRYLFTYFIIDVLAILPLPQLVILLVPSLKDQPVAFVTKESLKYIIICQYVPRIVRIVPLYIEVSRTSSINIVPESARAGAALNLLLYMLASHVLGAIWYLLSVETQVRCWGDVARKHGRDRRLLYCNDDKDPRRTDNSSNPDLLPLLNTYCPLINPDDTNSTVFNFGIFIDALQSGIVETRDFPKKFFYCFWWGLRNLSSVGQNLKTSTFVGQIIFAVVISIAGLVLFALLIGNMQKYLQSITAVKVEELRIKKADVERWMKHRMLSENLKERIRHYQRRKWQATRGVDEESLMSCLPRDLRVDIKHFLCLDLLMRVPMFEKMDEQLIDAMCDRLKPVLYTEKSYIEREGDPVQEVLFIIRGNLVSTTTNGGITGFFNAVNLKAGDFCGEALLTWALDPQSSSHRPISTRTVQALSDVEAFALLADDLKFLAPQHRRLHSKQPQNIFRFYSVQWKTWAASFIQAAWRRYCRRKFLKLLREEEARLQNALADDSGVSVGASIYVNLNKFINFVEFILMTVHSEVNSLGWCTPRMNSTA
ncbi:hypothetical protein SLEP1_g56705 [Rubroshorea leprosula]|uniref:Cyclic nucleotide-binding domain-containing protein n=1 Tax=Rubroshorea leprosula TaxID=152421 RepID=A0AAV5MN10_9ROSI|nr:hypothetical protein SLEP1_g56705 [Rubroshorea leprosula]